MENEIIKNIAVNLKKKQQQNNFREIKILNSREITLNKVISRDIH